MEVFANRFLPRTQLVRYLMIMRQEPRVCTPPFARVVGTYGMCGLPGQRENREFRFPAGPRELRVTNQMVLPFELQRTCPPYNESANDHHDPSRS